MEQFQLKQAESPSLVVADSLTSMSNLVAHSIELLHGHLDLPDVGYGNAVESGDTNKHFEACSHCLNEEVSCTSHETSHPYCLQIPQAQFSLALAILTCMKLSLSLEILVFMSAKVMSMMYVIFDLKAEGLVKAVKEPVVSGRPRSCEMLSFPTYEALKLESFFSFVPIRTSLSDPKFAVLVRYGIQRLEAVYCCRA
ncbi:unnamed protein product [Linum tenue]|uniref:Uncharacterized protein n=1 Tax=Linum tenue TaxID=586396 RepID=A0AAV0H0F4_9ROSI|nr:unnamed protein product [Linum tenue]